LGAVAGGAEGVSRTSCAELRSRGCMIAAGWQIPREFPDDCKLIDAVVD
jgi:hypothetical protein